ncbi:multidrug effflux MFS transporter [Pseudodesulfovibrio tunisiensis]|uniref:multidrug effflux MFS transporter n=1 Tax=Pseudodesulfovibrio tunisiensis TaxID=463192 RepID=UPI001FB27A7D|nr:multidrug effflux MFS transporter [Pseudodesulfovibrio tunisiensis]
MIGKDDRTAMTFALAFIIGASAMSTDMYLPALPMLVKQWGVSEAQGGLTLSMYFVAYSISMLIYGPLSDRYGRRPIMLFGLIFFSLASLLCATAQDMSQLIAYRVLQSIGAGAGTAVGTAMCRDSFEGALRQRVYAYIGVIIGVAPIVAPSLGGLILEVAAWQWIFVVQGLYGLAALVCAWCMADTLPQEDRTAEIGFITRYRTLFRNREYMMATVVFCLVMAPFYAHLATSPFIYMKFFGLDQGDFARFFALNALGMMLGAWLCAKLSKRVSGVAINTTGFCIVILAGACMIAVGGNGPLWFALPMVACSFGTGIGRPVSVSLSLEQVNRDIGSASSMMTFILLLFGAGIMWLASLDWPSRPVMIGIFALCGGGITLMLWPVMLRMFRRRGTDRCLYPEK